MSEFSRLTRKEMQSIEHWIKEGASLTAISRKLNRPPSTIIDHVKNYSRPDGTYSARYARKKAYENRMASRSGKGKTTDPKYLNTILTGVRTNKSPKELAEQLDAAPETVYRHFDKLFETRSLKKRDLSAAVGMLWLEIAINAKTKIDRMKKNQGLEYLQLTPWEFWYAKKADSTRDPIEDKPIPAYLTVTEGDEHPGKPNQVDPSVLGNNLIILERDDPEEISENSLTPEQLHAVFHDFPVQPTHWPSEACGCDTCNYLLGVEKEKHPANKAKKKKTEGDLTDRKKEI